MRLKPEHINHIIEKYSHARTHLTDYTKDVKHDIAEALFPQLTEEQLQEKIKFMPWNPTYIQELCARAKDIIDVFTQNPWLEDMYEEMLDIRLDSLASQKAEQQWAIDKKLIKRIKGPKERALLNYNTLVDALGHRLSDIENKFQLSWDPLFDDPEGLEHHIIEKEPTSNLERRSSVISYSVYDIDKIPLDIVDLALHGKKDSTYGLEREIELKIEGASSMDKIKEFLINAEPLKYGYIGGANKEKTERVLALEFEAQKVGYLVSESTPTAYADKSMSAYVNNFVRYRIFDHKEDIVKYFTSQLEPTLKKIEKWQKWLDTIDQVMPFLQEKYANIQDRESIASEIANIYFGGSTWTEQAIRNKVAGLKYKNRAADKPVFNAIQKLLIEGIYNQNEKGKHIEAHIKALEDDPDF